MTISVERFFAQEVADKQWNIYEQLCFNAAKDLDCANITSELSAKIIEKIKHTEGSYLLHYIDLIIDNTWEYPLDLVLYRARIHDRFDNVHKEKPMHRDTPSGNHSGLYGFAPLDITAPESVEIKSIGRVNDVGERCLYLANSINTACMEVRADLDDCISVMPFSIVSGLKILDFTQFKNKDIEQRFISFCKGNGDEHPDVFFIYLAKEIVRRIMYGFSKPIQKHSCKLYYTTVVIANILKSKGIDGIKYASLRGAYHSEAQDNYDAYNVVLFNPEQAKAKAKFSDVLFCDFINPYHFINLSRLTPKGVINDGNQPMATLKKGDDLDFKFRYLCSDYLRTGS